MISENTHMHFPLHAVP